MRFEGFLNKKLYKEDWLVFGKVPSGFWKQGTFFLISALNNVRESANQISMASNLSLKSLPEFLNRTGVSNV